VSESGYSFDPPAPASKRPAEGGVRFPEELPITASVREIALAIDAHPVVIVAGETGSGKTTQLPKIALAMGRGLGARIGVTQPRRIAATSVAARVAEELGVELGREVGYQIRFDDRSSKETYVKFMTDGVLLAELVRDPMLRGYDTLVIDEAHERSLNIDFLLGYLKQLLPKRPELRVVVSSATLETQRFSEFFDGAPVIEVSGRTFPVETIHRPPTDDEDLSEAIANCVEEITEIDPRGDILVFLPGEREIHEAMAALVDHALPHTVLLPLYGRLTQAEQARVFAPSSQRKVILSTNVAETSLTIPGIHYVVDSGLARINRYVARSGVTQLMVEPISKASAQQRQGRAGRVRAGVCFRLYTEQDFTGRPAYTDPELLRVGLAGVILQMKALRLGRIDAFPFLDPPPKRAVDEGYRVLEELGAIDDDGELTAIGKQLARLPLDPRIGRMIVAAADQNALREVLVIASALGVQDPRERPLEAREKADQAHRRYKNEVSDFLGLVTLFRSYRELAQGKSQGQLRRAAKAVFLSYNRMREWIDVHDQLASIARELGYRPAPQPASDEAVHKALLPGLLSRLGMYQPEKRSYAGARQTRFLLHPSSALARKPPAWVVVAELVETTQLYGRIAAAIDPTWLEEAGGALCRRSYGDPGYAAKPAQVMNREQVTLYGLPIVRDRRVHYGPIDPAASRRVFLLEALAREQYEPKPTPPFLAHNRRVFEEARRLRARARRSDLVLDDVAIAAFFESKVPEGIYSGKTFETWRKKAEAEDPRVLFVRLDDLLLDEAQELGPDRYPDAITLRGTTIPISYRFDPGEDDDGLTLELPLALLPQLDPDELGWTIPAWHVQKIEALIRSLPKALRRNLPGDVPALAKELGAKLRPFDGPMLRRLASLLAEASGQRIVAEDFDVFELSPHLRCYLRIVDGERIVGEGREAGELFERFAPRAREAWGGADRGHLEREGMKAFDVDELPEQVVLDVRGAKLPGYPALVDEESSVAVRVLSSRAEADAATRAGLRRLFLLGMGRTLAAIEKDLGPKLAPQRPFAKAPDAGLRKRIAERILDEAFEITDVSRFPRTKRAFGERLATGRLRLGKELSSLLELGAAIAGEAEGVEQKLAALTGKPGGLPSALADLREQLAELELPTLLCAASRERLAEVPRYLRAMKLRLERLPNGPQKDQSKAEQVLPFWREWLRDRAELGSRGVPAPDLEAYRWLLEELRVQVFAPELKAKMPVSPERLRERMAALRKAAGLPPAKAQR
jgi:ATP-dependent helicase HrpA